MIEAYSPWFTCSRCPQDDYRVLTIDHVTGDGAAQRWGAFGANSTAGHQQYLWLIQTGFPPGYQVLCWSCNVAKNVATDAPPSKHAKFRRKVRAQRKLEAVLAYSSWGTCARCGEDDLRKLAVDHAGGGGAAHRASVFGEGSGGRGASGGGAMYDWLAEHGFPLGFQVLCASCNFLKNVGGERVAAEPW